MSETATSARFAVLIDADNADPKVIEALLAEVARFGSAGVRRAYGDWTTPQLGKWKDALLRHAIQPMQQFANTKGKNSTDAALIIDAMDLLHRHKLDGFCIVSSDSDFTGLARRIREDGLQVVGFGERKTPQPFVAACDRFIFTEVLRGEGQAPKPAAKSPAQDKRLVALIRAAAEAVSDEAGWASLGAIGSAIARQAPEFDSRNWGFAKLSDLVRALPMFQLEERPRGDGQSKSMFLREG